MLGGVGWCHIIWNVADMFSGDVGCSSGYWDESLDRCSHMGVLYTHRVIENKNGKLTKNMIDHTNNWYMRYSEFVL